ncbi:MAG: hypothetical protein MUE85_04325 [Microscillaceae bacterium]|jgi:hypothetical protein|nr:hypothetical protein [Microscillaceae bacterium]
MSYHTKNIISNYNGADDDPILSQLITDFKLIQVRTFAAEFRGLVGQVNILKIWNDKLLDEDMDTLLYALEEGIAELSQKFPHKKFVFIEADCFGGACLYSGLVMQNGETLLEQSYDPSGHIWLLQALYPEYKEYYFEPFTRDFFRKQGDIRGLISDFSMAGLFAALHSDYKQHPDYELLTAPTEYVLRAKNQTFFLHFIEQPNRRILIEGIVYQMSEAILTQLKQLIEDALYGLTFEVKIRDLESVRLRIKH